MVSGTSTTSSRRDDGDGVAVGVKADAFAGNVVDDDGIEILRDQLLAGVLENVFGLGGEADDDLRGSS